jgi:hypothetical protein
MLPGVLFWLMSLDIDDLRTLPEMSGEPDELTTGRLIRQSRSCRVRAGAMDILEHHGCKLFDVPHTNVRQQRA